MRLPTEKERVVIDLLLNGEETYAWDLVKKSDGQLGQNGIYVILMRMVARGLLSDRQEDPVPGRAGPRRRLYKLTAEGRAARDAYYAALEKYPRGKFARVGVPSFVALVLSAFPAFAQMRNSAPANGILPVDIEERPNGDWVDVGRYTEFVPDPLKAIPQGQWFDIAIAERMTAVSSIVTVSVIAAGLLGVLYLRKNLASMIKWGWRYAKSTFQEELCIAEEKGRPRFVGIAFALARATYTGMFGISPFGEAPANQFKSD